jgi:predicted nucleic acid-binding protein
MPDSKAEPQRCFVDTNIWLYALIDAGSPKRETAKAAVSRPGVVLSTQVINETCVNLLRQATFLEESIRQLVAAFYEKYAVADVDRDTLLHASRLRETYSLSFWDSMIVSSALRSGCDVLYTEDM